MDRLHNFTSVYNNCAGVGEVFCASDNDTFSLEDRLCLDTHLRVEFFCLLIFDFVETYFAHIGAVDLVPAGKKVYFEAFCYVQQEID